MRILAGLIAGDAGNAGNILCKNAPDFQLPILASSTFRTITDRKRSNKKQR